ncbi:MAG: hypothetical protein M1828_002678 [Chrysothrix sp. TS-e1954]|nr:MAG: hypothetical protein M1828_002678 [Chrysothrix sp. TS-e1954]
MDEAIEEPTQGFKQTAKDLFAGAAGGVAQVLIDIVKVRLQTSTQYSNALDCARKIWSQEGPTAFYKGTLTPLIGIGACVSVQFGGFHAARRFFEARNHSATPTLAPNAQLSMPQYYAAGAFAGITNSVISCPIEHIRIRLQTQPHAATPASRLYTSPLSVISTLSSRGGIAHGLFKGQAVTIIREAQAYGMWFLTYEYLMGWDTRRRGIERKDVEAWKLALYGGLAGEALWISSFPFDVVKSRMQTDGLGLATAAAAAAQKAAPAAMADASPGAAMAGATSSATPSAAGGEASAAANREALVQRQLGTQRYANMRDCFRQIYVQEGMAGFWKGVGPTLLRAMPVSAATFVV